MREKEVLVLDAERRFLEYTHPALARKLLKEGKASVYSKEPFAIQINRSISSPDRIQRNEQIMAQIKNFTEFFKEERDIYVQNISNCQVSVSFDVGGHQESFLFPNSKDPVNLTRFIPFAAVKSSMDLRRMMNRSPPALVLLEENEYRMYFDKQAQMHGLSSVDAAIDRAEERRMAVQNHQPLPDAPDPIKLHEVVQDGQHMGEKKIVRPIEQVQEDEEINPRVLNLCLQVHPQVPDQQKMSAVQLLQEIDSINGLNLLDWEYIQSHGYYKSVKNYARKKIAEYAAQVEEDDTTSSSASVSSKSAASAGTKSTKKVTNTKKKARTEGQV